MERRCADKNSYIINSFDDFSCVKTQAALDKVCKRETPVICCIGSDLVLGDSLGPIVGTMLINKKVNAYIYGSLSSPITAKEIVILKEYLEKTHRNKEIISIDAGVGLKREVGCIKISDSGIKPGLGVKKNLPTIGTKSIIGIVAQKTENNNLLFNETRLSLVYKMATVIADSIANYVESLSENFSPDGILNVL